MLWTLSLCLCVVFVAGNVLNCTKCDAEDWASCSGTAYACPAGQKCVSATSELTEVNFKREKHVTKKVARSCADSGFCNVDLSFNFKYASWKKRTACDKDEEPTVSKEAGLNDRECVGCIAVPSECKKTVQCRGEEHMCIKVVEIVAGNVMVSKGCATRNVCRQDVNGSDLVGTVLRGEVYCCEGNLCNGAWGKWQSTHVRLLVLLLLVFRLFV